LFRNGMWITNDVPYNKASDFAKTVPFNGVILLQPDAAKSACDLVGRFEGPRHIDIDLSREKRGTAKRRQIEQFFQELHRGIRALVPELDAEEHDPGFFSVEVTGDGIKKNTGAKNGGRGTPEPVTPRPPHPVDPDPTPHPPKPKPPRPPRPLRRQGTRIETQVAAVQRARGLRLRAKPLEDAKLVELRVVLADGSDETCDSPEPDTYLEIGKGATVDGKVVKRFVRDRNNKRRAILIGPTSAESDELDIWLPCRPPAQANLRVELIRRSVQGTHPSGH